MNVALVGIGRMGQRYEKVLRRIFGAHLHLHIVDPMAKKGEFPSTGEFELYRTVEELPSNTKWQLAVDAHPNEGRLELLQHFAKLGVKKYVVEKPSAKSLSESHKMQQVAKDNGMDVFLPFYRRYYPLQPATLKALDAGSLCHMQVTCGAIGLGCNGVHLIDLASYLFEEFPKSVSAQLQLDSIVSPRGEQFRDHAGNLMVNYPGGDLSIHMMPNSSVGIHIQLIFEHGRIAIAEQTGAAWRWWRRPDKTLPVYRTSMETEVPVSEPWDINLENVMVKALSSFMEGKKHPGLQEGHSTLATIAAAILSSENHGRSTSVSDAESQLSDLEFRFT